MLMLFVARKINLKKLACHFELKGKLRSVKFLKGCNPGNKKSLKYLNFSRDIITIRGINMPKLMSL